MEGPGEGEGGGTTFLKHYPDAKQHNSRMTGGQRDPAERLAVRAQAQRAGVSAGALLTPSPWHPPVADASFLQIPRFPLIPLSPR